MTVSRFFRHTVPRFSPSFALPFQAALALGAGWFAASVFQVHVADKPLLEAGDPPAAAPGAPADPGPLPLRLVDAGAVGIPADTAQWGTSYSHATHAFDRLLLPRSPWVDADELTRIDADWRTYVDRVAAWGATGIVVDAFLEFVNFDGVDDGRSVYGDDAPLRARHAALRDAFSPLFSAADSAGIGIYLKTDMLALTPELEDRLRRDGRSLDPSDPALWEVYAAGFDEVFRTLPAVAGVVIRIGEAGPLFNVDGLEYRSEMAFHRPEHVRAMLMGLLPTFERHGRRLVFRSWSVGVGGIGDLHNDPGAYLAAVGGIESPSLVVSTKYTQGDYFGFLPLNPTLFVGTQQRIVEFQARREFEGFGAFANAMGPLHGRALAQLRARNPNLVGISLWTQEGGPLRAGPMSLYPLSGFWRWIDANVYTTLGLASDPEADVDALHAAWVRETLSPDPAVVAGMTEVLALSRRAVEKAWYLRPYAERRVAVGGFEVPPLLWIQEWDQIGGWWAVAATLEDVVGEDRDAAIADGFEAVALTRRMREIAEGLAPRLTHDADYPRMLRSLEHQESLFETLALYRAVLLEGQHTLRTGADTPWQARAERFRAAVAAHEARWRDDLDFPAFEFGPALQALDRAREGRAAVPWARGALAVLLLWAVSAGWRRSPRVEMGWGALALGLPALTAALFVPPGRWGAATGVFAVFLAGAVGLKVSRSGFGWGRRDASVGAAFAPVLLPVALILLPVAVRGPGLAWTLFWTDQAARTVLFAATLGAMAWVTTRIRRTPRPDGTPRAPLEGLADAALAAGAAAVTAGVLLPDLSDTLRAADGLLGVMPMTRAILNGITVYGGLPDALTWVPLMAGSVLLTAGALARRAGRRAPVARPRPDPRGLPASR